MLTKSSEGGFFIRSRDVDPSLCLSCIAGRKPNGKENALPCEEVLDDNKKVIGRRVPKIGCVVVDRIRKMEKGSGLSQQME